MSDDVRIRQLLQQAFDSGVAPEEVCADALELLPEVRRRWEQCRALEDELKDLFPSSPAAIDDPADTTIYPRDVPGYEIESVLGRGGMGVVYRARHLALNRSIALKMLPFGLGGGAHERARLRREAQAVAALKHVNIVQVYDVGEAEGRPFFTMEYVDGGTLAEKLAGVPLPAAEAASLLSALAEAMEAAHRNGIVHRDLKPSNVLITRDGTPKISDFGLAMRVEGDSALTASGARVGTPSYMAPEQAEGRRDAVGPRADVYALGAILYEMLTGRPPFRGESPAETQRQLLSGDPVPPSRLNARVPRDLETICTKCLQKDPDRRYETAGALADDVGRFRRGEQILARRAGVLERAVKWSRRHPALTVAFTAGLLFAVIITGVIFRVVSDRSVRTRLVLEDLRGVAAAERRMAWDEARASLDRAKVRLGDVGAPALRARIDRCDHELKLVATLSAIRLERASQTDLVWDLQQSYREYGDAFRQAGFPPFEGDPAAVGARVGSSDVRLALIGALDDWTLCTTRPGDLEWLTRVAHRADGSPTDWRAPARDPAVWREPAALARLFAEITGGSALRPGTPGAEASATLLAVLGDRSRSVLGERATIPFLQAAQRAYPDDFWINFTLGMALQHEDRFAEAARYFQAAVSVRPDIAIGHIHLGEALGLDYRVDEAIAQFREAAALKPDWFRPAYNVGMTLKRAGRYEEALAPLREAVRLAPDANAMRGLPGVAVNVSYVHAVLAQTLANTGRTEEAIESYRRALLVNPANHSAARNQRTLYLVTGRRDEALATWGACLAADADAPYSERSGYAELALFLGHDDEYRRACQALLTRFAATDDPRVAEQAGRACLLAPSSPEQLERATAMIDRAVASAAGQSGRYRPFFLFAKGLSEYRHGRLDRTVALMNGDAGGVLRPAPSLLLAMTQERLGRHDEALTTLAACATSHDWSSEAATSADEWIFHALRREAEGLILPNLPAFLAGQYWPTGVNERIAMTSACQFHKCSLAQAQLWSDVLAAQPQWAGVLRIRIACAAAQAGCGLGSDAANLTDSDRKVWRDRARAWVREEVDAADASLKQGPAGRQHLLEALTRWSTSPEMAGVRDPACLERLGPDERAEWADTWKRVGELLPRVQATK